MAGIITEGLLELKDEDYRAFHAKLIPNIPIEKIIGVRTPVLCEGSGEAARGRSISSGTSTYLL